MTVSKATVADDSGDGCGPFEWLGNAVPLQHSTGERALIPATQSPGPSVLLQAQGEQNDWPRYRSPRFVLRALARISLIGLSTESRSVTGATASRLPAPPSIRPVVPIRFNRAPVRGHVHHASPSNSLAHAGCGCPGHGGRASPHESSNSR